MRSSTDSTKAVDLEAVKRAFKALRKQGVVAHVARGGCRCCYSKDGDQADKTPTAWGSANVWRPDLDEDPAGAYVRFGAVDGRGRTTAEVGQAIVAALAAEGVSTTWDGSADACIWIEGTERPDTQAGWDACHVAVSTPAPTPAPANDAGAMREACAAIPAGYAKNAERLAETQPEDGFEDHREEFRAMASMLRAIATQILRLPLPPAAGAVERARCGWCGGQGYVEGSVNLRPYRLPCFRCDPNENRARRTLVRERSTR